MAVNTRDTDGSATTFCFVIERALGMRILGRLQVDLKRDSTAWNINRNCFTD